MSAEEKARKLAEMSSNAEWRDETRKNRVKKGREQDEKEEKEIKTNDHSYYRFDFYSTEGHIMPKNLTLSKIEKIKREIIASISVESSEKMIRPNRF